MDTVDIKISEDLIKGIIETKVQTAIAEALSSERTVVEQVVSAALTCRVDQNCNRSKYDSDNKYTYIEALCKKLIRDAATQAVQQWAESKQAELEKEFLRQLQTKKTSSKVVAACVDGLSEATKNHWRFSVQFPSE